MNKKIVRGRTPYIYDAESVISVSCPYSDITYSFEFNINDRRLRIADHYTKSSEYMYGKKYRIIYIIDRQILREEQIKKLLK